ncbi:Uncharacterized protein APZ42_004429 [Daphnia magna]|uniref:Uncharacterized protein n=1 Tax=Daphnia magna TaxID=35525 RepID=A0A162F0G8_9CRUS|nr:Uncharacterized protein APZ42_004429 [Daphnia magna]
MRFFPGKWKEKKKENNFLINTWMLKLRYQEEIPQTENASKANFHFCQCENLKTSPLIQEKSRYQRKKLSD